MSRSISASTLTESLEVRLRDPARRNHSKGTGTTGPKDPPFVVSVLDFCTLFCLHYSTPVSGTRVACGSRKGFGANPRLPHHTLLHHDEDVTRLRRPPRTGPTTRSERQGPTTSTPHPVTNSGARHTTRTTRVNPSSPDANGGRGGALASVQGWGH